MANNNAHKRKLLTIVTEASIESSLVDDFEELGVKGYTIIDARGKGSHGVRTAGWETNSNIRIDIICNDELANNISNYLKNKYYEHYAMIVYLSDTEIFRLDKF